MAILKFLTHAPPSHNSQLVSAGHWVTAVFCDTIGAGIQRFNLDLNLASQIWTRLAAQASRKGWTPAFPWVTVEANVLLDLVPPWTRGDFRGVCCPVTLNPFLRRPGTTASFVLGINVLTRVVAIHSVLWPMLVGATRS